MAKNIINSVSYPVELQKVLDENPELSLSKMVQSKLIEIRENRAGHQARIKALERQVERLQESLLVATDEVEELKTRIKLLETKINVLEKKNSNKGIFGIKKRSRKLTD